MGQLINDLLDFSRANRKEISRASVNMHSLAGSVLGDLLSSFNGKDISTQVKDLPEASGDYNLLRQVWVNLLSNALKYSSKRDTPSIEVGSFVEVDRTVYYVRDNGTGFDMQYQGKLFGVFQRLHRAEEFEGTGVGLALVKRIIERHDGTVWAESVVDQGATFYFSLPKQAIEESAEQN
jgi:light-regulated signal transduction histidine kinase (bacteriophytochrome)